MSNKMKDRRGWGNQRFSPINDSFKTNATSEVFPVYVSNCKKCMRKFDGPTQTIANNKRDLHFEKAHIKR